MCMGVYTHNTHSAYVHDKCVLARMCVLPLEARLIVLLEGTMAAIAFVGRQCQNSGPSATKSQLLQFPKHNVTI